MAHAKGRGAVTALAVAAGYVALMKLGMALAIPPGNVTAVFPGSGLALGAAVAGGPWAVAGVWAGSLVGNALVVPVGSGWPEQAAVAACVAAGAAAQAAVQARWVRRHRDGAELLARPGGVLFFAGVVVLAGCLVSASVGTTVLLAAGQVGPGRAGFTWLTWWLGDAAGALLVGGPMLAWPLRGPRRSTVEKAALVAATLGLGALTLRDVLPMSHFLLPALVWAAYRFGPREASLAQLLIAVVSVGAALVPAGVYRFYPQAESLLLLQSFLVMTATVGLIVAALGHRQRVVEWELQMANHGLRQRAADLEGLNEQLRAAIVQRSDLLDGAISRMSELPSVPSVRVPSVRGPSSRGGPGLAPGTVVGGRARVVRLIDRGGMGDVYEAVDLLGERPVALKVPRDGLALDEEALRRFVAEARSAAAVDHPAVVRVLHVDVSEQGGLFLMLELVTGESLARRLERPPPLSTGDAARLGAVVAEALAAAHAAGVVHRDIKPANIMLTAAPPGLKVLDFGVARRLDLDSPSRLNDSTLLLGTPAYMPPEQIRDPDGVGPAGDVYSLGVMLFLLLTGRLPFERSSRADVLSAHLLDSPPPLPVSVPDALAALVSAMLAKEPSERPAAADLVAALTAHADAVGAPQPDVLYSRAQRAAHAETLASRPPPPLRPGGEETVTTSP